MKNYFKTQKTLQCCIDKNYSDLQEILDQYFYDLFEISESEFFEVPYWVELDSIEFNSNLEIDSLKHDDLLCEYIPGYFELLNYGDLKEIDGKLYTYLSSISLPEEIGHETLDSKLAYEYRGFSFLRIWIKL